MFEKNYRLQDIQLSKSPEGPRLEAAAFQYNPFRRGLPSLRLACHPKLAAPDLSNQTAAERRMVENTGLEPVTSWLQTRRSPS